MIYSNKPSDTLLPFAEYWVNYGSVSVPTYTLADACEMAADRARRDNETVEVQDPRGRMVAVARCDLEGTPRIYWRNRGLEAIIQCMVIMAVMGAVVICVTTVLRLH